MEGAFVIQDSQFSPLSKILQFKLLNSAIKKIIKFTGENFHI